MINDYNMKILISGNQAVFRNNTYTLIRVKNTPLVEKKLGTYERARYIDVVKTGHKEEKDIREILFMRRKEDLSYRMTRTWDILETIEICKDHDNFDILKDKDLFYKASFEGADSDGNAEKNICEHFVDHMLHLRDKDYHYLYDNYYDIRVYLREIGPQSIINDEWMRPIDIRNLNLNRIILDKLEKCSKWYLKPGLNDFTTEFATVSDKMQAQYFLTRFHNNTAWDPNMVCIMCFRLSAFVLPGYMSADMARGLPRGKCTRDNSDGSRYAIDSIHFNSDICFDVDEFLDLINEHLYAIGLE